MLETLLLSRFTEWVINKSGCMRIRKLQVMCLLGKEKPTLLHVFGIKKVDWPEGEGGL